MSKIVPVVIYLDGERKVIGSAKVTVKNGNVSVDADLSTEYAGMFLSDASQISLGPAERIERKASCPKTTPS